MNKFCCQSAEKMWQLTSPEATSSSVFVGKCAVCGDNEPYSYHVPEYLWRRILPKYLWNEIVCGKCFHAAAQQNAHLTRAGSGDQADELQPPAQVV